MTQRTQETHIGTAIAITGRHRPQAAAVVASSTGMGAVFRYLLAGAVVGVIGTMAHRMGASANIPYGLVIAYPLVIISTWWARSRMAYRASPCI